MTVPPNKMAKPDIDLFEGKWRRYPLSAGIFHSTILKASFAKDVERELKAYPYHRINTVGSGKGHTNKIACYSKFPILSSRILDYPSEYNGSVLYEIKIGEDTVTLINNHLESNKLTKADKVVYEDMLKSPEKEKVKSGARLLIRKLAEASAIQPRRLTLLHMK